jgi:hypothetical protein
MFFLRFVTATERGLLQFLLQVLHQSLLCLGIGDKLWVTGGESGFKNGHGSPE